MKTDQNPSSAKEGEYSFYNLLYEVLIGRNPIGVLFEHAEFQSRLKRICHNLEHDGEKAKDLSQETCLRLLRYGCKIRPDNVETTDQFFSWLYVVVRNIVNSEWRKDRLPLDDRPVEEVSLADYRVDLDAERFFGEFEEFSRTLPYERRRAIELRMEGYSYREIADILESEGCPCSHVIVRVWYRDALRDFFNRNSVKKAIGF